MTPGGSICRVREVGVENCTRRLGTGPGDGGAPPGLRVLSEGAARGFPPPPRAPDTHSFFLLTT